MFLAYVFVSLWKESASLHLLAFHTQKTRNSIEIWDQKGSLRSSFFDLFAFLLPLLSKRFFEASLGRVWGQIRWQMHAKSIVIIAVSA